LVSLEGGGFVLFGRGAGILIEARVEPELLVWALRGVIGVVLNFLLLLLLVKALGELL
jgi:hypothetical protein